MYRFIFEYWLDSNSDTAFTTVRVDGINDLDIAKDRFIAWTNEYLFEYVVHVKAVYLGTNIKPFTILPRNSEVDVVKL